MSIDTHFPTKTLDRLGYSVRFMPHDMDGTKGYRIYRNLHDYCWSVQVYIPGKGWRVWAHTKAFRATGCRFEVSLAGRERVRRTRSKNVHAFLRADFIDLGDGAVEYINFDDLVTVSYNPYDNLPCFTYLGNVPIWRADVVIGDDADIYVAP